MRRQQLVLSSLLLLATASTANATDGVSRTSAAARSEVRLGGIDLRIRTDYYLPETRWEDSVMMTSLPPGSLVIKYDGPQKLIIKHARSQARRYIRRYRRYSEGTHRDIDVWNNRPSLDAWWTRSWLASRTPEKGGAPKHPYVHTIGKEITWNYGPFTLSNMLRFKVDYVGVFKLNPDPGEKTADKNPPPAALDVRPTRSARLGTKVQVKVRPSIRIGLPKSGRWGWFKSIRSVSIHASIDVVILGVHFLKGEVMLKYKPGGDAVLRVELALASW